MNYFNTQLFVEADGNLNTYALWICMKEFLTKVCCFSISFSILWGILRSHLVLVNICQFEKKCDDILTYDKISLFDILIIWPHFKQSYFTRMLKDLLYPFIFCINFSLLTSDHCITNIDSFSWILSNVWFW